MKLSLQTFNQKIPPPWLIASILLILKNQEWETDLVIEGINLFT